MTAQIPEKLINKYVEISFDDHKLFSIWVGDPTNSHERNLYRFKKNGDPEKCVACSACWRGYVSVYEINEFGKIKLIRFEYPFGSIPRESDETDELLKGDFWLDLRTNFFSNSIFVPFKNGIVLTDKSQWIFDKKI